MKIKTNVDIPTVDDIIKLLEKCACRIGRHELLSDIFACSAICISNRVDKAHFKEREDMYLRIIRKYDEPDRMLIADAFAMIYILLASQIEHGFNDYLGELYMKSDTQNAKAGQFFTPYHVSKTCAEMTIDGALVKEHAENNKILILHEPACGSGGMIIAAADILHNRYHFNYVRNLFVECGDIDARCVHMTYLQLSLAGIPAVVYQRDALSMQTWARWETPAYIMQYLRFRNIGGDKIGAADRGVG